MRSTSGSTQSATNTRRSFLRSTGGVAAVAAVPTTLALRGEADAATTATAKVVPNPVDLAPTQPVMAYVHDAKKGTVVIMDGLTERTVQDHDLVRRLLTVPKTKRAKAKAKPKPARRPKRVTSRKGA